MVEYRQVNTFQIQEDLEVAEVTEWEAEQETNHLYHHLRETQEHLLYRIQQEHLMMEKVEAVWEAQDLQETDQTEAQEVMAELQIFQGQVQFTQPAVAAEFIVTQRDLEELQEDLVLRLQELEEQAVGMENLDKMEEAAELDFLAVHQTHQVYLL